MAKRKKQEITMIDMKSRLELKIISGTEEEGIELQRELDEIDLLIEKKMQLYEEHLRKSIMSIISEEIIVSNRDAEYFLNTYQKIFENRNTENIQNRMKQHLAYISEAQSKK